MSDEKLRPITVRVPPEVLDRAEKLAALDRRPVGSWLRLRIEDAVAASRHAPVEGGMIHA